MVLCYVKLWSHVLSFEVEVLLSHIWSLLNLMARQILMACLIFNGFESGATARVLTSFALLA